MNNLQSNYLKAKTELATARTMREVETAHLFVEGSGISEDEIHRLWTASTEKHKICDLVKAFDAAQAALADWGVQVVARSTPSKKKTAESVRYHDVKAFADLAYNLRA